MNLQNKLSEWKISCINSRYRKVARKLYGEKNRKINIIFVNCESSKWAYQYIYEKFASDDRYNVKVVISVYDMLRNKKYSYLDIEAKALEGYNFFKKQGITAEFAYDFVRRKYLDLRHFSPDIVFYDEPQSITKVQSPDVVSKYALTMYCSYGSCISNGNNEHEETYKSLTTYFVDNDFTKKNLLEYGFCADNLVVAGQPKIDAYLKPINFENKLWKTDKKHIIFAPHFSFSDATELKFGTFNWNYKFFFDYAKNHPEFEFILKPHPSLKREIVKRKLMSFSDMQSYFKGWDELENAAVDESGNYLDMFRTSDLLITDCNSFLFEYLPSKKPVIQLINPKSKGHNEFGKKIIEGYYKAHNISEIEEYIEKILIKGEDSLKEKRQEIIDNILKIPTNGVSQVVYDYVNDLIARGK